MRKLLILILTIATFVSCSSDYNKEVPSELKIRLSNISQFDFQNIVVNTSTGNVEFEDINAGQSTEYKIFKTAYRYAFVELVIDEKIYTLQPLDYVGETPLKNGKYTYQINANDSQSQHGKLSLILIEE